MHPLLQRQVALHTEATKLLEDVVFPLLKPFGDVSVSGSYVYELLYHPDIDLQVLNSAITREMYTELCMALLKLDIVSKLKTTDRVNFPHEHPGNRPTGYWIAPEIHYGEHHWSLDIWLQTPEWSAGNPNPYTEKLSNLSEPLRIAILSLKEQLLEAGLYGVGKEFQSVDVYDAVLKNDARTVEDLRKYKKAGTNA